MLLPSEAAWISTPVLFARWLSLLQWFGLLIRCIRTATQSWLMEIVYRFFWTKSESRPPSQWKRETINTSNFCSTYERVVWQHEISADNDTVWKVFMVFVCVDLKVIALLQGLLLGYTKFCCFCVSGIVGTENPFCQKTVAKEEKSHSWEEKCYL
jgi:hypothetical protein